MYGSNTPVTPVSIKCLDSGYPDKLSIYRCALLAETLNEILRAMSPLSKVGSFSHLVRYLVLMEELHRRTNVSRHMAAITRVPEVSIDT